MNALAYNACEKGFSVHFTRVIDMINTLTTAQLKGTLEKTLKIYIRPALLLLDELGYLPIDRRGANLLFQVVAARDESGAIVLSTNRPFRDWGQTFDVDNTLATARIDRLMHHGEPILIQGDSSRMKDKRNESPYSGPSGVGAAALAVHAGTWDSPVGDPSAPFTAHTASQRLPAAVKLRTGTTHAALLALALPNVLWVSFPSWDAPIPVWESESR